jgi:hypothetical protein
LPGEGQEIEIEYPVKSGNGGARLEIRGWNVARQSVQVTVPKSAAN